MLDLKACTVCFSTDVKLNDLDTQGLRNEYNVVSGLKTVKGNGLPKYLCVECCAYVKRSYNFHLKCQRAFYALQEILNINKEIKLTNLKLFDTAKIRIAPSLSFIYSDKILTEASQFQWQRMNRGGLSQAEDIPVIIHNSTDDYTVEVPKKKTKTTDLHEEYDVEIKQEAENTISDEFASQFEKFLTNSPAPAHDEDDDDDYFDKNDVVPSDDEPVEPYSDAVIKPEEIPLVDGSKLEEEYAKMVPMSITEAKAVVEIQKKYSKGKYPCSVCLKTYHSQRRLTAHARMHDKHFSGSYECELCIYYYKTDYLLKTHMTEKHMYKYLCKKCPEVSYNRTSAKQHFVNVHMNKEKQSKNNTWYQTRPKWLATKGGMPKHRGVVAVKPKRKVSKLPDDFLIYTPVSQEDQYALIKERQNTRNYKESHFKCESCYRGFREFGTYSNHMKKHDSEVSGKFMCDMCKLFFPSPRKMYKHMNITHLFRYNCQRCSFICYNRGQAQMHYKWHNNFTYSCPHCNMEFKKISTRLTHIRIKHPSTFICNLCGHSYVSEMGLVSHRKLSHSKEELVALHTPVDTSSLLYCADCDLMFANEIAFATHLTSSNKHAHLNQATPPTRKCSSSDVMGRRPRGRPARVSSNIVNNGMATSTLCEICSETLSNDVQARKHYQTEHPGTEFLKRYMCDVCGHTTKQYANLLVHMRTHTNEKPYECPHCDRRFSMPSNRDRHIVVHTGEKRYQCQHCNRRFTQSSAVKLHIQTVHLKIPYAPWDKKNRKRRKELEGTAGPVSTVTNANPMPIQPQPHKLLLDAQGDYLNAYITYNE